MEYSRIQISRTLGFLNLPITQNNCRFPWICFTLPALWRIQGEDQGGPDPPPPPKPFETWLKRKIKKNNNLSGLKLKFFPPKDRIINWFIFKNETCVALRRSTKYQNCSSLYIFQLPSNGWLCSKSSRAQHLQKHLPPAIWRWLSLWPRSSPG